VDVASLLEPVSAESAAGDDLSYSSERHEIEQAFEADASAAGAGSPIDWRKIVVLIEEQSKQTKDVWLAVYLMRCGIKLGKISVVADGADMLVGLLEQYWDNVHPSLEEYDFRGRKSPCEVLTKFGLFLSPFQNMILVSHNRWGDFSGADIDAFAKEAEGREGFGMFCSAMAETPVEDIRDIALCLQRIRDAVNKVDVILMDNAGDDTGVDFKPTYEMLDSQIKSMARFIGLSLGAEPEDQDLQEDGEERVDSTDSGAAVKSISSVESRDDVIRALEAVAEYYRRKEPGSPVAAMIMRARGWVNLDFISIMRDLAPGSLDEVERVLVTRQNSQDDYD
jgi:type VI secretion system ImpA family protein